MHLVFVFPLNFSCIYLHVLMKPPSLQGRSKADFFLYSLPEGKMTNVMAFSLNSILVSNQGPVLWKQLASHSLVQEILVR